MTTPLLREALDRAGVDDSAVDVPESFSLDVAAVDWARSPLPPGMPAEAPLQVHSDALAAIGLRATFDPERQRMAFTAPADLAFAIEPATATAGAAAGEASVPTNQDVAFVIASTDGVPLAAARLHGGRAEFAVVRAWPAAPLETWRPLVADADWALLAAPPSGTQPPRWKDVVIAGRLARLVRPADAGSALRALLAGDRTTDGSTLARTWLRTLTPLQRAAIERFAVVQARPLADNLGHAHERLEPYDEPPFRGWHLFHLRDDLEGVRVLLREADADAGAVLAAVLDDIDAVGRALRFSWPPNMDTHDERLQRVAEADPAAWWGSSRYRVPVL